MDQQAKPRVNANMLSNHINQTVILMGEVITQDGDIISLIAQ